MIQELRKLFASLHGCTNSKGRHGMAGVNPEMYLHTTVHAALNGEVVPLSHELALESTGGATSCGLVDVGTSAIVGRRPGQQGVSETGKVLHDVQDSGLSDRNRPPFTPRLRTATMDRAPPVGEADTMSTTADVLGSSVKRDDFNRTLRYPVEVEWSSHREVSSGAWSPSNCACGQHERAA